LPRGTSVGGGFFLPHGHVIINGSSKIGRYVTLYQFVTLGVKGNGRADAPIIEDGAIIYSSSTVVGGVTIGKNAVVGANSFVSIDVPAGTLIAGEKARVRRSDC